MSLNETNGKTVSTITVIEWDKW